MLGCPTKTFASVRSSPRRSWASRRKAAGPTRSNRTIRFMRSSLSSRMAVSPATAVCSRAAVWSSGAGGSGAAVRWENALEPERVSEKLHQNTFWMGRGGTLTHTISGIDIALWDIVGKAPANPWRAFSAASTVIAPMPYCSILMEEPGPCGTWSQQVRDAGFRALKIGWGPFGPPRRCEVGRGDREERPATVRRSAGYSSMPARATPIGHNS